MKRISLTTIIFFSFTFFHSVKSWQREVDSLKNLLNNSRLSDSAKVKLTLRISETYHDNDPKQALAYALASIERAKKLNWKKYEMYSWKQLSGVQIYDRDFAAGIASLLQVQKIAEDLNDSLALVSVFRSMGEAYRLMDQNTSGEEYLLKALDIARKINSETNMLSVLTGLDAFYTETYQEDKAEKCEQEAMILASRLNDEYHTCLILQLSAERAYTNKNYRIAATYYLRVIDKWKTLKNRQAIAYSRGRLGKIYADLGMKDSAYFFANSAFEFSKKENLIKELSDSYEALYYVSKVFGDYKKSLEYYLVHDSLEKASYNADVAKNTERLRLSFEQEKKDVITNAEIKRQKVIRNFAFAGSFAILALGGYVFYNFRRRKRYEKQEALSIERLRISRELHDDIGSTLGSIAVYSDVAKRRSINDEVSQEALGKIGKASRELIEKMGDIIWNLNPENENFEQLLNRMQAFAAMILTPRNIHLDFNFDESLKELSLSPEHRKNLFLIFKESIHNVVKHAEANNVSITLQKENDVLKIRIRDDGKGFEMNSVQSVQLNNLGGNGLKSMTERAKAMVASFTIGSKVNEGTTVDLSINI